MFNKKPILRLVNLRIGFLLHFKQPPEDGL